MARQRRPANDPELRLECLCADDFGASNTPARRRTQEERDHVALYDRTRESQLRAEALARAAGFRTSVQDSDDRHSRHSDAYLYFRLSQIDRIIEILREADLTGDILDVPEDFPAERANEVSKMTGWRINRTKSGT
jgi:hypothetical protein